MATRLIVPWGELREIYLRSEIDEISTFIKKQNYDIQNRSISNNTKGWKQEKLAIQARRAEIIANQRVNDITEEDIELDRKAREIKSLVLETAYQEMKQIRKYQDEGLSVLKQARNLEILRNIAKNHLGEFTVMTDSIWKAQQELNASDINYSNQIEFILKRPDSQ